MADHEHPTPESRAEAVVKLRAAPVCIACGTDFSEGAMQAVEVAANLAKCLDEPLLLIHGADPKLRQNLPEALHESICAYAQEQLQNEADRLRSLEVPLRKAFRSGEPGAMVLAEAAEEQARLLVLGGIKGRAGAGELCSRMVEQVAEAAPIPTLMVRDAAPLLRWTRGERRLRVFVGADFSAASQAALRWVDWLRQIGPCDVIVAVLEPGPQPPAATDGYPATLVDDMALESQKVQERFFRQLVQTLLGRAHVRVRFEYDLGRSDAHLIQLAIAERADLLVFGTDSHAGARRFDYHPVSRGLLRYAPFNIACVPGPPVDDASKFPAATMPSTELRTHER